MSGRKETKILPPGYKAPLASKPSKPARKSQLSEEIVIESENSSESDSVSEVSSEPGTYNEGSADHSRRPTGKTSEKRTQQEDTAPVGGRPTSSSKSLHGFEPISTAKSGAPTVSDVFSKSNLSGKEIWHIMIPSSVPVKDFSQIALDDIKSGKAVTTHNGVDYGFVNEENSFSNTKLLVPSQRESEYRAVHLDFAKTLHLQLTNRPLHTAPRETDHDNGPRATSTSREQPHKRPRKQPQGLKMRFVPAGRRSTDVDQAEWSSSAEDKSDEEHARSKFLDQFQVPKGLEGPAQSEGREHAEGTSSEGRRGTSINPAADNGEQGTRSKESRNRGDRSKRIQESIVDRNAHKSSNTPSQDTSHRGEEEQVYKKRKAELERDEHGRRRETSAERAKRKKREREQRKRDDGKVNGVAGKEATRDAQGRSDKKQQRKDEHGKGGTQSSIISLSP